MGGEVARPVAQARVHRRVELGPEDVDLGVGEVGQPAGVVGVEVGGDDLADVARGEAEGLDLLQRGLADLGPWPHQGEEGPELARVARVLGAEAGVEQGQPVVALDQRGSGRRSCPALSSPPSPLISRAP